MTLHDEIKKQGNWLFRWRSYVPLLIIPIMLAALKESAHPDRVIKADTLFWEIFCLSLSFIGLAIRCLTVGYVPKGTSGRNTKEQIAEVLNTLGMYSIVRHPLYLGNFIISLGMVLFVQVWWFVIIAVLAFWLYYERIIFAEEEFLREKFGNLFLEWANKTPTFLPNFRKWQRPILPFSFRTVLKREYTGFFVITVSFPVLEVLRNFFAEGKFKLDLGWKLLFIIGLVVYLTLRTLKRKTKILAVEGR